MKRPSQDDQAVCCCDADITFKVLPTDLREASGQFGLWVHDETGDWFCYPDDPDCKGEPAPRSGSTPERGDR